MSNFIDLTGQRFSKLVVIGRDNSHKGITYWKCRCDCGEETIVTSQHLRNGKTKSCGCGRYGLQKANKYDFKGPNGIGFLPGGKEFIFDKEDFEKVNKHCWNVDKDDYVFSSIKGGKILLHRLLINCPDGMVVDHINRNPLDNRKENLRICTLKENVWNRKFRGYTKVKDKYRVTLWKDGKLVFRELCDTEEKAKEIRRKAELFYFGDFAYKESVNE